MSLEQITIELLYEKIKFLEKRINVLEKENESVVEKPWNNLGKNSVNFDVLTGNIE